MAILLNSLENPIELHGKGGTVARYIKREVWIEETEVELPTNEVMTISQAAKHLGVYTQAVSLALDRGDLTLIINQNAPKRPQFERNEQPADPAADDDRVVPALKAVRRHDLV